MKITAVISILLALPTLSLAVEAELTSQSARPGRTCKEYKIPLTVSSVVFEAKYNRFKDNFDVVSWVNNLARRDQRVYVPLGNLVNATGKYSIVASFCSPTRASSKAKTILVATSGLGYDRRYWDSDFQPEKYNFVDYAINRGYSVFFYDRLGTGESTKVSGYDTAQASTQVEILKLLTKLIRNGQYTGSIGKPAKVAHIGHSFGSFVTGGFLATSPELSDAGILTGIDYNGVGTGALLEAFGFRIAETVSPGRYKGRDNNYLATSDPFGDAAVFFHGNDFDRNAFWYTEKIKQPLASIELLTLSTAIPDVTVYGPPQFKKPVMVISGEYDLLCGGNCDNWLINGASYIWQNAQDLQVVVHPGSGHGMNFNYNATGAYKVMLDYLKKHDL